jgi:hypothetical protein
MLIPRCLPVCRSLIWSRKFADTRTQSQPPLEVLKSTRRSICPSSCEMSTDKNEIIRVPSEPSNWEQVGSGIARYGNSTCSGRLVGSVDWAVERAGVLASRRTRPFSRARGQTVSVQAQSEFTSRLAIVWGVEYPTKLFLATLFPPKGDYFRSIRKRELTKDGQANICSGRRHAEVRYSVLNGIQCH